MFELVWAFVVGAWMVEALLLGSVATGLARGAGIPVLLVDDEPVGNTASPRPLQEAV